MTRPGPQPSYSVEDIVKAIVAARPPALGISDLADEFDVTPEAMRRQLHRHETDGYLNSATVGGSLVWWPTEDGRRLLAAD